MRAALMALLLAGCAPKTPGPADGCERACSSLYAMHCTWAGTREVCRAVCENAFESGMKYPVACVAASTSCESAARCR